MMDYTKEIERLQKAQEKAQDKHVNNTFETQAVIKPALSAGQVAVTRRMLGQGMLVPVALLVGFAWTRWDNAWDGYYLYPIAAMFVMVPLLIASAVLGLRHFLLDRLDALEHRSPMGERYSMLRHILRWMIPSLLVLTVGSFINQRLLPSVVPVGQWLGLAAPPEPGFAAVSAANDPGPLVDAASYNNAISVVSVDGAMDAVKPGDGSLAPNAPRRVGEPTTLLDAVEDGNVEATRKLIAKGQDVNARYPSGHASAGMTLLHVATGDEDSALNITQALIKAGAKVDAPSMSDSFKGFTPLHAALSGDNPEVIQLLLDSGARMDAADKSGWQALHYGSFRSSVNSFPLLILAAKKQNVPVDVPAMGSMGETALMKASERSFLRGITSLVNAGADLNLVDKREQTALDYAKRYDHDQAIKLLCMLDNNALQAKAKTVNKPAKSALGC